MEQLIVNIGGPTTDYYDSYGKKLCELARGLDARGVYANVVPLKGELVRDNQPEDVQDLLRRSVKPAMGGIMLGYPTTFNRYPIMMHAGPTVAVTAWESTIPPSAIHENWERLLVRVSFLSSPVTGSWNRSWGSLLPSTRE